VGQNSTPIAGHFCAPIDKQLSGQPVEPERAGTFKALIRDYQSSPEFLGLATASRRDYARYLQTIEDSWGELSVDGLEPRHVLQLRDRNRDTPAKANYLMRVLSAAISWGVPRGYRADNPCTHIKKLKTGNGYAAWSWDAITHFRTHAPKELWWVAALALYTGQRQGDVLKMKFSDIEEDLIAVVQEKTGKSVWIPIHADLRCVLNRIEKRSDHIATNTRGAPWETGFRASWRKTMAKAEMAPLRGQGLVFHGLRKSAVVCLLEAGCTDAEVAAITGQSRQMIEHYAQMVNRKRLAASAILKWESAKADDFEPEL